jgi:HK97 family phage major capsid protein/HK97 family phage prohead protease
VNVQALWFRKNAWTERTSREWCEEHDFKVDSPQHTNEHWIWRQAELVEGAVYRTIADDFPEGVSATVMQEEEDEKMDKKIKSGSQSKDSPFTFILSTEDKDRDGDIIRQNGIKTSDFKKNPIALYQHDHRQPIGVWENIRLEGKKLLADLKLAAEGTSELIDTIRKLIEQRIIRAVSIGFMVEEAKPLDEKDPWGGYEFIKTSLLEASLVSVPANQNALRAKAAKIVPDSLKGILMPEAKEGSKMRAQKIADGKSKSARKGLALDGNTSAMKGKTPMNIAERIRAKEERLVAVKDRLTELKNLIEEDEDYELNEDEETEIDTLKGEQESIIKSIETMKGIMSSLAAKAQPVRAGSQKASVPAKAEVKEKGGSLLVKTIAVHLIAHMTKSTIIDTMESMYGDDERVKAVSKVYGNPRRLMQKAAVDAADTTTVGWAAELVRDDMRGFLEELRAVSVYAQLLASPGAQSLDFGGSNTVTIPRRNRAAQSGGAAAGLSAAAHLGSQMGGAWVGEGGVIPVKNMALTSQTLSRYKLAVIAAMTNEILDQSVPNIEGIIRSAILEDTALAVDGALLDGMPAVAGVRPASPFAGAPNQASLGSTAANIINDLKYLLSILSSINGANPVLIMNSNRLLGLSTVTTAAGNFMFRDEIASGRLMGIPVLASTTVNPATVGIIDAGSFVGANDAPAFAISDQATLTMANADGTAPTQAGDKTDHTGGAIGTPEQVHPDGGIIVTGNAAGAPAGASVAGYMAQSMFQQYQTAIRMVMPASWGMIRAGSAGYVTGVAW